MQCQRYFPVFYSRNDLNTDANKSTRSTYNGYISSAMGHYNHGSFASSSAQGFVGYDKEFLRWTIIKHEATFKDQVRELHRLYRRQKELLAEIKRNQSNQTRLFTNSQWSIQSALSQRTVQGPPSESFNRPSISGTENDETSRKSTGGRSISEAPLPSQNVGSLNLLGLSLSGCKRTRRKPLNLQLPAEEYINSEDEEPLRDEKVSQTSNMVSPTMSKILNVVPMGHVRLPFATRRLDAFSQVGSTSQAKFFSQSIDFAITSKSIQASHSGSQYLFNGPLGDCHDLKKQKICAVVSENAKMETGQGWQPANGNGKEGTSLNSLKWGSYPHSLQRLHSETAVAQTHGHPATTYFHKKDGPLGNEIANPDPRVSESINSLFCSSNAGPIVASCRPALEHPAFYHSVGFNSEMQSLLAPRKTDHGLIDVPVTQACPNSTTTTVTKISRKIHEPVLVAEFDHSSGHKSVCDEVISLQTNYYESSKKASSSGSCFLYNHDLASSRSHHLEKDMHICGGIDLNSVAVMDSAISPPRNIAYQEVDGQASPEVGISKVSSSCNGDAELRRDGGSGSLANEMIHNPSTFDGLHGSSERFHSLSSTETPNDGQNEKSTKSKSFDINLPCDTTNLKGLKEEDPEIDLKFCESDDGISHGSSSSNNDTIKADLNRTVSPENYEHSPPRAESEENNKTESRHQISSQEDCDPSFLNELENIAANALISISTSKGQTQFAVSEQFKASQVDCLSWFAEVVCSRDQEDRSDSEELSSDGNDYFEAMTLKLTEMGSEDYPSWANMAQNEKQPCVASPLSDSQPRRCGRKVKRAKMKDLQREVLPSLAAFLRCEVTEELQMIEGLMEANSTPWKMGAKAQKMGGNRRPRKGKQPCYPSPDSEDNLELLVTKTGVNNDVVDWKDERVVGWEKAKRRRGRRCPISHPCLTLSQDGWMRKWGVIGIASGGNKKQKWGMIL